MKNSIFEYSAFHSQQAVEKFLKAFLVQNNQKLPRTHDIKFLIKLCMQFDKEFEHLFKINADKLTIYAKEGRYPEYEMEVTKDLAKEAIEIAEKVRDFVMKKLKF